MIIVLKSRHEKQTNLTQTKQTEQKKLLKKATDDYLIALGMVLEVPSEMTEDYLALLVVRPNILMITGYTFVFAISAHKCDFFFHFSSWDFETVIK